MSIATGGIDSQIQDKMDTYRSNPQALQKAVGVTKQTVDVMALQKLISEKKEKAKALMAEAEQNPNTIAQQREQEALAQIQQEQSRTLGDLTQQTAGTLNTQNAARKRGMNKLMKNAGKKSPAGLAGLMGGNRRPSTPLQGGPQAAGLPNARMMQAAQGGPVRRMAGGGIVGFAGGLGVSGQTGLQGVTQEQIDAFREKNKGVGLGGFSDDAIRTILAGQSAPPSDTRKPDPLGLMMPKNQPKDETPVKVVPESKDKTGIAAQLNKDIPVPTDTSFSDPYAGNSVADPKAGGITQVIEKKPTLPPTTTTAGTVGMSENVMGTVNDISSDVAFDKGVARSDANLKRDETNKSYEDMKAQLAAFDAENYGENDDIYSFLIGTGGTGSIGAAAKGGKQAMDREIRNKRNRLLKSFELETDKMGADREIGTTGLELGKVLAQEAAANERNIRTNTTNMTMKEMTIAQADANRISEENRAELTSADQALDRQVRIMQVDNQTMQLQQRAALDIMTIVSATRDALTLKEETNGSEAEDLAKAIEAYEDADTVAEKKAADEDLARIRAKIALLVDSAMNRGTEGSDYNMLEMETEAQRVFIKSLQKPTGGRVIGVR